MSDGEALLRAVLANPDEDTPRLVYADWLQENGEDARAEFVRVQVRIAHIENTCDCCGMGVVAEGFQPDRECACGVTALRVKAEELLSRHGAFWGADLPCPVLPQSGHCTWDRGFISGVRATAEQWVSWADAIRAAHPVRKVTLTTWPYACDFFGERYPGVEFEFPATRSFTFANTVNTYCQIVTDPIPS